MKETRVNRKIFAVTFLFSNVLMFTIHAQQNNFPILKGPYLGQKPPGLTPELFAPSIICFDTRSENGPSFSNDGKIYTIFDPGPDGVVRDIDISYDGSAAAGTDLVAKFKEHAKAFDIPIELGEKVTKIRKEGDVFKVLLEDICGELDNPRVANLFADVLGLAQ